MTNKVIITPSFMAAVYEVEALVLQGYRVSTKETPYQSTQCFIEMEPPAERATLGIKTKVAK